MKKFKRIWEFIFGTLSLNSMTNTYHYYTTLEDNTRTVLSVHYLCTYCAFTVHLLCINSTDTAQIVHR